MAKLAIVKVFPEVTPVRIREAKHRKYIITDSPEPVAILHFVYVINLFVKQTLVLFVHGNPITLGVPIQQSSLGGHIHRIREDSKLSQLPEINVEEFFEVLTLHFDADLLAVLFSNMHLTQRCCCQCSAVKKIEKFVDWLTKLLFDNSNGKIARERRNIVLEKFKLFDVLFGYNIDTR